MGKAVNKLIFNIFFALAWSTFCYSTSLFAQGEIQLNKDFKSLSLQQQMHHVRLPNTAQLSEVLSTQSWQQGIDTEPLISEQALWLSIDLHHKADKEEDFILSLKNPTLDQITAYVVDDMGRIHQGFYHSAFRSEQNQRLTLFPFSLWPSQEAKLVIKIEDDGPMSLNMMLWQADAYAEHENALLLFIGIVTGAMVILASYFLITYILLRNPIRYWFALACLSFALLYLNIQGIFGLYTGLQAYSASINTLIVALVLFTACKFSFALIGQIPSYWRVVAYILCLALACSAFLFVAYWQLIIALALAGAVLSLQMFLAWLYHQQHHSRVARFYASGWLLIGCSAFIQSSLHLLLGVSDIELFFTLVMVFGLLLLTVAVEVHQYTRVKLKYQNEESANNHLANTD